MPTANTPSTGQPISIDDIRIVFGLGNNLNTGDDLDDFHGIYYYDTFYPYARGRFNTAAGSPLTLSDFYDKSAIDPAQPGFFYDDTAGVNKTYTLPVFRNSIQIAMWGAGGGGGSGFYKTDLSTSGSNGSNTLVSGTFSNNTNFTITAAGGISGKSNTPSKDGAAGAGGSTAITPSFASPNFTGTLTNGNAGSAGSTQRAIFKSGAGASASSITVTSPYGLIVTYTGGTGGAAVSGNAVDINGNKGSSLTGPGAGGSGGAWRYNTQSIGTRQIAGGGAGSGATVFARISRLAITPGSILTYTVGAGGAGGVTTGFNPSGTELAVGTGGNGSNGAILIIWS